MLTSRPARPGRINSKAGTRLTPVSTSWLGMYWCQTPHVFRFLDQKHSVRNDNIVSSIVAQHIAGVYKSPAQNNDGTRVVLFMATMDNGGVRKAAPHLVDEGPCNLPVYVQQEGLLDLDHASWLCLGYRKEEWQYADARMTHSLGKQTGAWYWTLEIIIPISGQPGLEIRRLPRAVGRLAGAPQFCSPIVPNRVGRISPRRFANAGDTAAPVAGKTRLLKMDMKTIQKPHMSCVSLNHCRVLRATCFPCPRKLHLQPPLHRTSEFPGWALLEDKCCM